MDNILEVVLRSSAVYLFIVLAIRIFGKTQLSQLSVFDLVFILLISEAVQNAMIGENTSLVAGLIAALSLFILNYILKVLTFKYPKFEKLIEGEPIILIRKGKIIHQNLKRVKLPISELETAIRQQGMLNENDVDLAILETDGNISIISTEKSSNQNNKKDNGPI